MILFNLIVFVHTMEHVVQMLQLYFLGMTRKGSLGVLGMVYPWLVKSELLHWGMALITLAGLIYFLPQFKHKARVWLLVTLNLQIFHYIEHQLLLSQYLTHNLYDFKQPVSITQVIAQSLYHLPYAGMPVLPRIELHFAYNLIILIPMVIALSYKRLNYEH